MADLAQLDVRFDPTPLEQGRRSLEAVVTSAKSAERAANDLGQSFDQAGKKVSGASKMAERMERDYQRAQKAMGGMSNASQRMVAEFGKIERAAEQVQQATVGAHAGIDGLGAAGAQAAAGLQQVASGLGKAGAQAAAANQNVKLAAHEMVNLSRQGQDVITMLAMGATPMQVFTSQAAQIYDAISSGDGGLAGGFKRLGGSIKSGLAALAGFATTPLGIALALGTAATAAIYFATRSREKIVPLTDAMEAHQKAVGAIADAYGVAASAAGKYQKAASGIAAFNVRQSTAQLRVSARASLREAFAGGGADGIIDALSGNGIFGGRIGGEGRAAVKIFDQFKTFEGPLLKLLDGLAKGTERADEFVDEVAELANLDPANAELQKAAKRLIDMAAAAADAQRQINGFSIAFSRAAEAAKRFRELGADLGQFVPDRRTDAQRIEQTYEQMMRLAKTEADVTRAQDLRRLSLGALAEAETRRRDGYELDIRSITARSAAERGQIEYQRVYADVLASTNDKAQATRQAEEARSLTMKQAAYEQTEAMNDRIRAGQAQVDQIAMEIELFGKSAGEVARLTVETQLLTQAREAARQVGGVVDPAEEQAIRDQAAAIGELTDRMTRMNLGRDQE